MSNEVSLKILKYATQRFKSYFGRGRKVVVFHGKHGDTFFVVKNEKQAGKVFFKIFKERVNDGYWYDFAMEVGEIQGKFGVFKDRASQEIYYNPVNVYDVESDGERLQHIIALHKSDPATAGILAFQFLDSRQDHQYEGYSVEPVTD